MSSSKNSQFAPPLPDQKCTYEQLEWYLRHKHDLPAGEREKYKYLIDNFKECWEIWNRVRWDAAMKSRGVLELKKYLGNDFIPYFDSSWALANEWNNKKRTSKKLVEDFYQHTPHYMYNSTVFFESGDRINFHDHLLKLIDEYNITSAVDYGCGVGNDGLMMVEKGIKVSFVDFLSPTLEFLKWRLQDRSIKPDLYSVHELRQEKPGVIDADMFWSIDVIEHMLDQTEIFKYIPTSTKLAVYYTDDDEEAGTRHPFHFKINHKLLSKMFSDLGFRRIPNDLLVVWYRENF